MDIVVLAGGLSPERDVSLSSGCLIANALSKKGHRALLVDLFLGLKDVHSFESAYARYHKKEYHYTVPETEPDLAQLMLETGRTELMGENVLPICQSADIVFLALHGDIGENGQIQAVFDTFDIPYTGTRYAGSLLAMDKVISKEIMSFHGIQTPAWTVYTGGRIPLLPCVIKPIHCGSSLGVSLVQTESEFQTAIQNAMKYEDEILIERMIAGREFSIGILDGEALPVIEILPTEGFYDYKNKYQPGRTAEVCPAVIEPHLTLRLQECALKVHKVLKLGTYSRVDFIMDETQEIFCLEANTLPGMTPTSLLPQEALANGLSHEELCQKLVMLSCRSRENEKT